jgi:lipopolysaccharide export system permease protein
MKTYEKYIFSRIAGPMLLITLGIVAIAWLSRSLKFIDLIVNKGLDVSTFLYLTTLTLPSLLWVILPVGLFLAITYAYNKLSSDSEIIILKASGIGNFDILKPALYFSLICLAIGYSVAFYFLPTSYREFKDMQNFIRNNYASILLQEGVFSTPTAGLTVYIKERDDKGIFNNLLIHDSRDEDKDVTIIAQKGFLENSEDGPMFILKNGSHQELNRDNNQASMLYFDRYNLQLNPFKENLNITRQREAKERYIQELLFPEDSVSDKEYKKFLSEFNNRITWPLYSVLLALIAMLPFIRGSFRREGNVAAITVSSIISIASIVLALSVKSLAGKYFNLSVLMYLLIFGQIAFFYYYLVGRPRAKKYGD